MTELIRWNHKAQLPGSDGHEESHLYAAICSARYGSVSIRGAAVNADNLHACKPKLKPRAFGRHNHIVTPCF